MGREAFPMFFANDKGPPRTPAAPATPPLFPLFAIANRGKKKKERDKML